MPIVDIRALRKSYGSNEVLKGIDLQVEPGEVIAIIGKSGSGKSTLLRCINGLEEFQSGSLTVDGTPLLHKNAAAMRELFAPLSSPSGFAVTDTTAMSVSTVYACMTKIAGAILQLPIHQYKLDARGDRERLLRRIEPPAVGVDLDRLRRGEKVAGAVGTLVPHDSEATLLVALAIAVAPAAVAASPVITTPERPPCA